MILTTIRDRAVAWIVWAVLGVTFAPVAGCMSAPASEAAALKKPQSMADLLVNVREATRSGMILDHAFVTEDNLKHVFGGSKVKLERTQVESSFAIEPTSRRAIVTCRYRAAP